MTNGRPAVFIDRDGTLIEETGYLAALERLVFFPYAVDAVRQLNHGGFAVVVITNQAGIARGIVDESFVGVAHRHIDDRLNAGGASVAGYYYCPHHPEGIVEALRIRCDCRKPKPGMLLRAAQELQIDLARSFTVGDRWQDVEAGAAAGTRTILVRTGYGLQAERERRDKPPAVPIVDNLAAAAASILSR
jgi:D-glycero-D-manno-heptose 1,7-bisphosphate phosphatase